MTTLVKMFLLLFVLDRLELAGLKVSMYLYQANFPYDVTVHLSYRQC